MLIITAHDHSEDRPSTTCEYWWIFNDSKLLKTYRRQPVIGQFLNASSSAPNKQPQATDQATTFSKDTATSRVGATVSDMNII